jgi:hypothetical protein
MREGEERERDLNAMQVVYPSCYHKFVTHKHKRLMTDTLIGAVKYHKFKGF